MTEKPIRILHVFSTFAVGGPQRRFAELANNLPGYEHLIAACDGRTDAETLLTVGAEYDILNFSLAKGSAINYGNVQKTRRLIRAHKPDLLCTYNFGTMEIILANKSLGTGKVPHLHFEDGFGPDESQTKQLKRRVLLRRSLLGGSTIVVPSHTLMDVAIQKWGFQSKNIQHIDNGVDLSLFSVSDKKEASQVIIGSVGALRPEKNLSRLLEVFHESGVAGAAHLVIAGDGSERSKLEALVTELSLEENVTFTGHVSNPRDIYATFDIFALTSDTEQMPLSILEAMATGLPVIATAVGDVPTMVSEENLPHIHSCMASSQLIKSMQFLVGTETERFSIGEANRKIVEQRFSREGMFEAYNKLFQYGQSKDRSCR